MTFTSIFLLQVRNYAFKTNLGHGHVGLQLVYLRPQPTVNLGVYYEASLRGLTAAAANQKRSGAGFLCRSTNSISRLRGCWHSELDGVFVLLCCGSVMGAETWNMMLTFLLLVGNCLSYVLSWCLCSLCVLLASISPPCMHHMFTGAAYSISLVYRSTSRSSPFLPMSSVPAPFSPSIITWPILFVQAYGKTALFRHCAFTSSCVVGVWLLSFIHAHCLLSLTRVVKSHLTGLNGGKTIFITTITF